MSEDENALPPSSGSQGDQGSAGGAGGSGGSAGGGSGGEGGGGEGGAGGSSRANWQDELAARLAEQKAKREAAQGAAGTDEDTEAEDQPPPTRDQGTPEWQAAISGELEEAEDLALEKPDAGLADELAGINAAQATWASKVGEARQALTQAASVVGQATSAITAFLAPVPAMLLVFLNYKVPIPIPIPVMYKPESLSWSKKAEWENSIGGSRGSDCSGKDRKTPMRNVPQATFKGGGPELLDIELFFDTTDTQLDVRMLIKPIQALVYKVPLRNEPPLVMFSWGMILSKMSYIEELEIDYTYFRADGTPLRAEVEMTLTEYDLGWLSAIPMNPTSVSEARKTWVVTEGQTLDWIAYQEYGNSMHWRHIAEVNQLSNPRDLRSGQILKLTPLP